MCQRFQTWRARAFADSFGRPRTVDAGECQGEQDPRIYGFVRESRSGQKFGCEPTLVINAVKINRLRASGGRLRSRSPLELWCSSVLQAASVRAPWKRARGGASLNRSIGLSVSKRVCVPTDMREKITPPATAKKRGRGAGAAGPVRGAARGSRTPSSAATCAPRASCGGCATVSRRRGRGPSAACTFYIVLLLVDHIIRPDTSTKPSAAASGRGRPSSY